MRIESDIDDYEDPQPGYVPTVDPVSEGVGSSAYLTPYTLPDCVERFAHSTVARFPERFDRFYFDASGGPLLVDVLADGTPEQLEHERARKRVEFKTEWCAQHGRRYLPLPESASTPDDVRALLDAPARPAVSEPATPRPPRRGQLQRPKATA